MIPDARCTCESLAAHAHCGLPPARPSESRRPEPQPVVAWLRDSEEPEIVGWTTSTEDAW